MRSSAIFFSLLSAAHAGIGPVTDLHIVNKVISPDGFTRSTVLAGQTPARANFPGPLITAITGANFKVNVINSLTDSTMMKATSIHWHGLLQTGTPWNDGPVGVTQCPIIPGQSFSYNFKAPGQAGTFWYHSHYSTQYCDGLRGPLVIYDPLDPHRLEYEIDDDNTVITLAEWYHTHAPSTNPSVDFAAATLINGKGRYPGGPMSPLALISVISGLRYRFRLISISCDPNFIFAIDSHTMTIIEVDGINVRPLIVDSIQIFAGQRYSFVLKANQPIDNYWIRAKPNNSTLNSSFDGGLNSAILRYLQAPDRDPKTSQTERTNPLLETNLHPLTKPAAPGIPEAGAADVNIYLAIGFDMDKFLYTINGATFIPPTVPILLQILSGVRTAHDLLPSESVYTLPKNKVIEVTIPGGTLAAPHPFHLHGHTFSVIRSAGNSTYNFVNPVRRDVVSTGAETTDNVTIRFTTDNAGPWIFHCHIDWHLNFGLAVVFAEDVSDVPVVGPPSTWNKLCPAFDAADPDK